MAIPRFPSEYFAARAQFSGVISPNAIVDVTKNSPTKNGNGLATETNHEGHEEHEARINRNTFVTFVFFVVAFN